MRIPGERERAREREKEREREREREKERQHLVVNQTSLHQRIRHN